MSEPMMGSDTPANRVTGPVVAVIPAAGVGQRFGGPIPKQIRKLSGQALISLSVEQLAAGGCTHAIVVIKDELRPRFEALLAAAPIPIILVKGGNTRQESVFNGLLEVKNNPRFAEVKIVLVHDAVRPLTPASVVKSVIDEVASGAVAVTPVINITDSVRQEMPDGTNKPIDRATLRAIQTPQGFDFEVLFNAHQQLAKSDTSFTDDVSCCEAQGHRVTLVPGSKIAMKVTDQSDLAILEVLTGYRKANKISGLFERANRVTKVACQRAKMRLKQRLGRK